MLFEFSSSNNGDQDPYYFTVGDNHEDRYYTTDELQNITLPIVVTAWFDVEEESMRFWDGSEPRMLGDDDFILMRIRGKECLQNEQTHALTTPAITINTAEEIDEKRTRKLILRVGFQYRLEKWQHQDGLLPIRVLHKQGNAITDFHYVLLFKVHASTMTSMAGYVPRLSFLANGEGSDRYWFGNANEN